jgi:hypothetical protein
MSISLRTGLSPFDVAQGDPEALEASKDERRGSWFDALTTSGYVPLARHTQATEH